MYALYYYKTSMLSIWVKVSPKKKFNSKTLEFYNYVTWILFSLPLELLQRLEDDSQ